MKGNNGHLLAAKLELFATFAMRHGYMREPPIGEYEVGRFRKYDPSGTWPPVILYRKKRDGDYLTVVNDDHSLLKTFAGTLGEFSPLAVFLPIETDGAEEASTSPAPAEPAA